MRTIVFLLLICSLTAQELPQAVETVQRLDQAHPWFNAAPFALDSQGNIYTTGGFGILPPAKTALHSIGTRRPQIGIIPPPCVPGTAYPILDEVTTRSGPLGCADVIVIKLDPTGERVLYGTAVGGIGDDVVIDIKVDAAENAYIIGRTSSDDFPSTSSQGGTKGGFVLKLDSAGRVVYITVLGWAQQLDAVDIDAAGQVYFGGSVLSGKLPASPSAYLPSPNAPTGTQGLVASLDPAGAKLLSATYLPEALQYLRLREAGTSY